MLFCWTRLVVDWWLIEQLALKKKKKKKRVGSSTVVLLCQQVVTFDRQFFYRGSFFDCPERYTFFCEPHEENGNEPVQRLSNLTAYKIAPSFSIFLPLPSLLPSTLSSPRSFPLLYSKLIFHHEGPCLTRYYASLQLCCHGPFHSRLPTIPWFQRRRRRHCSLRRIQHLDEPDTISPQ